LQERTRRLRALEDSQKELSGFLHGNEGLHHDLAEAETAVHEVETVLTRERLEADAHQRLRDLFDECRQDQVENVMGPIAERVLGWSRMSGLGDYKEIRFGDRFLPDDVLTSGATDHAIRLHEDSYGTAEQLSLLVRLALGGILAKDEPAFAMLDDPL